MKKIIFLALAFHTLSGVAQQPGPSVVNVTGEGIVKVVPDKVLIRARVEHTGKSASEVKAKNDEVVSQVLKYLTSQGIPSENFQTEYISLNKEFNYNTKETLFSANQTISILLEDLERYESLMAGLLQHGLNRIDGIEFKSSQQEDLERQARKEAILNAKQKATELAQAIGQKIGTAHVISEVESGNFPPPMYRSMEMRAADAGEEKTLAPGEMEITIKVNAAFFLM